jgi:hypothetical protein
MCVREFREKVRLMRQFRGERVFAVVTLTDTYMATRFGGRQRPELEVKRWIRLGPEGKALPAPSTPSLPPAGTEAQPNQIAKLVDPQAGIQMVTKPTLKEQMGNDEVPFNDSPDPNVPRTSAPPVQRKPASSTRIGLIYRGFDIDLKERDGMWLAHYRDPITGHDISSGPFSSQEQASKEARAAINEAKSQPKKPMMTKKGVQKIAAGRGR